MAIFKIYSKAKPIFVIRYPNSFNKDLIQESYKTISKTLKDYYVLAYKDRTIKDVQFECFNCEFNDIEFNELKERLLKTIFDE